LKNSSFALDTVIAPPRFPNPGDTVAIMWN
jgi:hypothetical protein